MKHLSFARWLVASIIVFCSQFAYSQQVMMQGFYWQYPKTGCGANWANGIQAQATNLAASGFTNYWFPPFAGNGDKSGGYDPRDLYIGPNNNSMTALGTKGDIIAMTTALRNAGISPVGDMVYNHRDAGLPEKNDAVRDYIMNYAGNNNGNCPDVNGTVSTYKNPYPSDRYRMVIPIGGSTGRGAGDYYFNMQSRSNGYVSPNFDYMFHATTKKKGGSRWSPVVTPDVDLTGSDITTQTAQLGRNYKNRIESAGDNDEFKVTITAADFNATGDSIVFEAINFNGNYSDHRPWKIWYAGPGTDIVGSFFTETYTNFNTMPSGAGGMNWTNFRPNYTGGPEGNVASTCLGPAYSRQSMDYFYDLDHSVPSTETALIDWTKWAWDVLGVRSLRMDAIKHFEASFVAKLINAMVASGRTPDLAVGEWYGSENPALQNWVNTVVAGLTPAAAAAVKPKVFDFPLRYALKNAIDQANSSWDARAAYNDALTTGRGMSGFNVVTMVNNHDFRDANRTYDVSLVQDNPILGYAYILTNNQLGVPTVFWPDYYGYPNQSTTGANGCPGDAWESNYFPTAAAHPWAGTGLKSQIDPLINVLKTYINGSTSADYLNKNQNPSMASSDGTDFLTGSTRGNHTLVYQLNGTGSVAGKEVIVAINFDKTAPLRADHRVIVGRNGVSAGTVFRNILRGGDGGTTLTTSNSVQADNQLYMDIPAGSYAIFVQETCPCISNLVASKNSVCSNATSINLTANATAAPNVKFVYSATPLSNPYVGGTSLGTAAVTTGMASISGVSLPTTKSTYYVYAIPEPLPTAGCTSAALTLVTVDGGKNECVTAITGNTVTLDGTADASYTFITEDPFVIPTGGSTTSSDFVGESAAQYFFDRTGNGGAGFQGDLGAGFADIKNFHVTYDATFLYLTVTGPNICDDNLDLFIAIDTDNLTGPTQKLDRTQAPFNKRVDFAGWKPEYFISFENQGYAELRAAGGAAAIATDVNNAAEGAGTFDFRNNCANKSIEFRIPLSQIGGAPNASTGVPFNFAIYTTFNNDDYDVFDSAPGNGNGVVNEQIGDVPYDADHCGGCSVTNIDPVTGTTDSGCGNTESDEGNGPGNGTATRQPGSDNTLGDVDTIEGFYRITNIGQLNPITPTTLTNFEICSGTSVNLLTKNPTVNQGTCATTANPAALTWYSDAALTTTTPTTVSPTMTTTYYVAEGCFKDKASVQVIVNPNPTATTVLSDCIYTAASVPNGTRTLTVTAAAGTPAYNYTLDATAQPTNVFNIATGTHSVTVQDSKGCQVVIPNIVVAACAQPVRLVLFEAIVENNDRVKINWATEDEVNNDVFEVQRSGDLKSWKTLTTIKGAGNTREKLIYTHTDMAPLTGTGYYRLKQTDFDKSFSYSAIKVAIITGDSIRVFPNPTTEILSIDGIKEPSVVSVIDMRGVVVETLSIKNNTQIPMQKYPSGSYLVQIKTDSGQSKTFKVQIQN